MQLHLRRPPFHAPSANSSQSEPEPVTSSVQPVPSLSMLHELKQELEVFRLRTSTWRRALAEVGLSALRHRGDMLLHSLAEQAPLADRSDNIGPLRETIAGFIRSCSDEQAR